MNVHGGRPHSRLVMVVALAVACVAAGAARAQTQVSLTKHNLTPSGPGTVRTTVPSGVCVFCHTPHNANPTRGLWNTALPSVTYQLYASSTARALLNQPTGSSRLCLSCHDGVLAPGNLRVPPKGASFTFSVLTGAASLGTDLRASHPVSFVYDSALAVSRGQLADPASLPAAVRLDASQQLQCTSCHDPHEDRRPMFLRTDTRYGALCTSCHQVSHWVGSTHAVSTANWNGNGASPWPADAFATVAENACVNCHRSHAAGHGERLLAQSDEPLNCTSCHAGTVAAKNVQQQFLKPFRHDVASAQWTHAPGESPSAMTRHVACEDCHNAHAVSSAPGTPPLVSGRLRGVQGVTVTGAAVAEASFEYEVCSKCHGLAEPTTLGLARAGGTRNIRLKIDPSNASFHPLAAAGKNPAIVDLEPGYTAMSLVNCTSCHTTDDATPLAPQGPHGSINEWLLGWQYLTSDPVSESSATYALCYQCHNRSILIGDQAHTFHHNSHVVTGQASCATCHDAHGSRPNAHLIDFMLRDRTGKVVVSPSASLGRLEYTPLGTGHGQCYLMCHGVNHEPLAY
jgi:predicted CXXCH cytochrome family protein